MPRRAAEAVEGEIGDCEAGDDRAEGQGAFDRGRGEAVLRGEVSHHAAGEAVAGAGGIDDLVGGKSGEDEGVATADHQAAVLALFDDDEFRAHGQHCPGGLDKIALIGQQAGFAVVEDEAVDFFEQVREFRSFGLDPEVHGVSHDQPGRRQSRQCLLLKNRVRVGQKDVMGIAEGVGDFRRSFGQDVEIDLDGFGFVHVLEIRAVPAESLAAGAFFQPGGVDVAAIEDGGEIVRPIIADNADEADGGEETGGAGEVDGRSTDDVLAFAERCFECIQADRSGDEQGH